MNYVPRSPELQLVGGNRVQASEIERSEAIGRVSCARLQGEGGGSACRCCMHSQKGRKRVNRTFWTVTGDDGRVDRDNGGADDPMGLGPTLVQA